MQKVKQNFRVKIGQMIMVGFRGDKLSNAKKIIDDIKKYHIGGVIIFDYDCVNQNFDRNIKSLEQVSNLLSSLQKVSDIPLFVAVDQEGGKVARFRTEYGFPDMVSHKKMANMPNYKLFQYIFERLQILQKIGINVNFAPCVDVNLNPNNPGISLKERSFSENADEVIRCGQTFLEAEQEAGVIGCLKHYPGKGSASADAHLGFVDVSDVWQKIELTPYIELIKSGAVKMVMTNHVFNRRLDENVPCTLSYNVNSKILRDELGFKGVLISDDIQMKAIADNFGLEDAVVKMINSGVDIILCGNNLEYWENAAEQIFNIIAINTANGKINQDRIDEAYERIIKLKEDTLFKVSS